jgi:tRNA modification GTPase
MQLTDTIASIATAISPEQGSIAVVRLSGDHAQDIARKIFVYGGKQVWESHRILYGKVVDPSSGRVVDECLLLLMLAPRSYTREDVVEFHCHGGIMAVQQVLQLCLAHGARLAQAGEFTLRAFCYGRIDLAQAEAIHDLVCAKSQTAAQMAIATLQGKLGQAITRLRQTCIEILADIEAHIDFAEDLPPLDQEAVRQQVGQILQDCRQILHTSDQGQLLRDGIKVAIIGRPNVGKSSLLNAWTKSDRAIVTPLPGTTRDIVDAYLAVRGLPVQILDTAGIRATSDQVERLGIERSQQAAQSADLVLLVVDQQVGWQAEESAIYATVQHKRVIVVLNKCDLAGQGDQTAQKVAGIGLPMVKISALHAQGMEQLEETILQVVGASHWHSSNWDYAINQRQKACLVRAVSALENLQTTIKEGLPLDFWTIDLREAIASLGEITGQQITESMLDSIFSRFCIGK